jgi:hypothetical protein
MSTSGIAALLTIVAKPVPMKEQTKYQGYPEVRNGRADRRTELMDCRVILNGLF